MSVYTIASILLGLACGLAARQIIWSGATVDSQLIRYISFPGTIYIRVFYMMIVPLLVVSLTTSMFACTLLMLVFIFKLHICLVLGFLQDSTMKEQLDNQNNPESDEIYSPQKLIGTTIVFFMAFSAITAFIGVGLMIILSPGSSSSIDTVLMQSDNSIASRINHVKDTTVQRIQRTDMLQNILM